MEGIFFLLAFVVYGFVKLLEWLDRNDNHTKEKRSFTQRQEFDDSRYLERIFILDAAANGVFVPGAERVFDDEENEDDGYYEDYEDDYEHYSSFDEDEY